MQKPGESNWMDQASDAPWTPVLGRSGLDTEIDHTY